MINFNSDKKESKTLTICKNGQNFKFEVETPQDFLNAFQFMFEAEAIRKGEAAPLFLDEAWSFQLPDQTGDPAIGVKGSDEKVFKILEVAEKNGLKPDIRS
jgi:hypothetical protein